jgi:hypothetical protein
MEDGTDAIEIGAEIVLLVLYYFWGHVVGTSAMTVGVVLFPEPAFAEPEVSDIEMSVYIDEDVLWLR